jgi:rhodanese-related sulfurtransferase
LVGKSRYRGIEPDELYRKLAMGEPIVVLDVRTPTEYAGSHIPGATLLPLQELQNRWREVPNGGTPIAVLSQGGLRANSACGFLAERNVGPLYRVEGGMGAWDGPTGEGIEGPYEQRFGVGPSRFLVECFDLLPKGLALDIGTGEGRNAIYLASRGFDVDGIDWDADRLARARVSARRLGAPIRAVIGNLEDGTYIIPLEEYDVIMVFNYLHRPLFPDIRDGVKPGGAVLYETFTVDQPRFGRPTNPDFLLEEGELREVFGDWEVVRYFEGVDTERLGGRKRAVARILARKPE